MRSSALHFVFGALHLPIALRALRRVVHDPIDEPIGAVDPLERELWAWRELALARSVLLSGGTGGAAGVLAAAVSIRAGLVLRKLGIDPTTGEVLGG
jgi:hypothetical protein